MHGNHKRTAVACIRGSPQPAIERVGCGIPSTAHSSCEERSSTARQRYVQAQGDDETRCRWYEAESHTPSIAADSRGTNVASRCGSGTDEILAGGSWHERHQSGTSQTHHAMITITGKECEPEAAPHLTLLQHVWGCGVGGHQKKTTGMP